MPLLKSKKKRFKSIGREKIEISIHRILSIEEGPYEIGSDFFPEGFGGIEEAYSVTVSGETTGYVLNGNQTRLDGLTVLIRINSSRIRHTFEQGLMGGAIFREKKYLDIEINVEPQYVRNIIYELRRDKRRSIRVEGYLVDRRQDVFRVTSFTLYPGVSA